MPKKLRFFVLDGYSKESRDQFDRVGMRLAGVLYEDLVKDYLPDAACDIWYSSDPDAPPPPSDDALKAYDAVIWPGCNLTVYEDDPRVKKHLELAARAYELGVPQFGSCWGIQIAAYTAGGKVAPHPDGREMGLARYIQVTDAGKNHPMFGGKPPVYCHFVSHDDHIVELPKGALRLAGNYHSAVQAIAVEHKNGVFWATQYHPEYNLHEVARLILARIPRLLKQGFFRDEESARSYSARLDELYADPGRKDLRWRYDIGPDVLDHSIRTCEFRNWLDKIVLPKAGIPEGLSALR
ncbi:MAG TPA: type 1 glutamine amidotransferase [Candidatus Hydrogenedentes bacterium]|nr:type 1 glutamine amidotransferase [Candidatus Hydrogenedentota bacterium]HPG70176.1 type 1 glutamine amidotransferase [Candidatus Hydrogenedentota bacterium]